MFENKTYLTRPGVKVYLHAGNMSTVREILRGRHALSIDLSINRRHMLSEEDFPFRGSISVCKCSLTFFSRRITLIYVCSYIITCGIQIYN